MIVVFLLCAASMILAAPSLSEEQSDPLAPTMIPPSSSSSPADLDIDIDLLIISNNGDAGNPSSPSNGHTSSIATESSFSTALGSTSSVSESEDSSQTQASSKASSSVDTTPTTGARLVKVQARVRMNEYGKMDHDRFISLLQSYFPYMNRYSLEATPCGNKFTAADIVFSLLVPSQNAQECQQVMGDNLLDIFKATFSSSSAIYICFPAPESPASNKCMQHAVPWESTDDEEGMVTHRMNVAKVLFGVLAVMFVLAMVLYVISAVFARRSRFAARYEQFDANHDEEDVDPILGVPLTKPASNKVVPDKAKEVWVPPAAQRHPEDFHLIVFGQSPKKCSAKDFSEI